MNSRSIKTSYKIELKSNRQTAISGNYRTGYVTGIGAS